MNFQSLFQKFPTLETDRLLLRKLERGDAQAMFEYASLPRVSEYCSWPCHKSLSDSEGFLDYWIPGCERGEVRDWAWVRKSDGKLIGTGGLVKFDEVSGTAELGYVLHPDFWGQGFATEATQAIIRWAFQASDLFRIIAHGMIPNKASARVLEKCGFKQDACLRQMFRKHGVGVDVLQFSLLRRDVVGESVECKPLGPEDFPRMQEITLHAFQYDPVTGKPIQGAEPSESPYLRKILENAEGFGIAHGLVLEDVLVAYIVYTPAPQSGHTNAPHLESGYHGSRSSCATPELWHTPAFLVHRTNASTCRLHLYRWAPRLLPTRRLPALAPLELLAGHPRRATRSLHGHSTWNRST